MTTTQSPAPGPTPAAKPAAKRPPRESRWSRIPLNVRWMLGSVLVLALLIGGGFGAELEPRPQRDQLPRQGRRGREGRKLAGSGHEPDALFAAKSQRHRCAGSAGQDVRQSRRRADRQGLSALVVRPGRDPGPRTERIARTTLGAVGRIGPIQGNRSPARKLIEMNEAVGKASWARSGAIHAAGARQSRHARGSRASLQGGAGKESGRRKALLRAGHDAPRAFR